MAGHFQTLLGGVVADADRPIDELPLLTEPEPALFAAAIGMANGHLAGRRHPCAVCRKMLGGRPITIRAGRQEAGCRDDGNHSENRAHGCCCW